MGFGLRALSPRTKEAWFYKVRAESAPGEALDVILSLVRRGNEGMEENTETMRLLQIIAGLQ